MLSQKNALGLLFFGLAVGFGLIAFAAAQAGQWVISVAAAALAVWMLTMSFRLLSKKSG